MSRARILILLVAIGCALLAGVLVQGMLNRPPEAPVIVEAPKQETVQVLIAAKDLAVGERLNKLSVEWRDWPRDNVSSLMITKEAKPNAIEEIEGSRAKAQIFLGEPILQRKIVPLKDGSIVAALLPEGLVALSIRVSPRTAVSGFVMPNDRVDVIATLRVKVRVNSNREDDKEVIFSRSIVSNARVIAINQTISSVEANVPNPETAVLELDLQQAELVSRAEAQGELALALRSIGDSGGADARPYLSASTADPNSVSLYYPGYTRVLTCGSQCDPTLEGINAPFPLIVRDGVENLSPKR